DNGGDENVAPIRVHDSDWKPRRLVAIRDLKTSESKSAKDRHSDGLLDELQLALYARAWEIAHPGDLVVAAGISLFSHNTEHRLEMSPQYSASHSKLQVGTRTDFTTSLHRFADEPPSPASDPFRAWLAQRLSVALGVAARAASGNVHPTPSKGVCRYCPVSNVCEVRMEDDF
ncbi:MAG: PD-(D/E)XK nuclease family protein, partial [Candidatus Thalassarchaeum sp.]|nr:PD-(D/E)XK nuclease family protein [Candidatus Thalassarchaeum sp.]MDP7531752.1 PD-(D/E)XK nuclease family protein [Candidatus Thalassarchaeum sp.]